LHVKSARARKWSNYSDFKKLDWKSKRRSKLRYKRNRRVFVNWSKWERGKKPMFFNCSKVQITCTIRLTQRYSLHRGRFHQWTTSRSKWRTCLLLTPKIPLNTQSRHCEQLPNPLSASLVVWDTSRGSISITRTILEIRVMRALSPRLHIMTSSKALSTTKQCQRPFQLHLPYEPNVD